MRVDRALLTKLLEAVEREAGPEIAILPDLPGYNQASQRWHTQLLIDGGYVSAVQLRPYSRAAAIGLTIVGQQLLDQLRSGGQDVGRVAGIILERVFTGTMVGMVMAGVKSFGI